MVDFRIDRFKYNWRGEWTAATEFIRDDVVSYNGSSYVCIKAHTASSLFNDDLTNQDTTNTVPDPYWVKMTDGRAWRNQWTASSVYDPGDIVAHGGNIYLCIETHQSAAVFADNNNKWAVYGTHISFRQEWQAGTRYGVNDVVRYSGIVYRCVIEHNASSSLTDDQDAWAVHYQGLEYKQEWNTSITYRVGDVVKFGASLYQCKLEHTPVDDSDANFNQDEFWNLLAPGYQFRGEWDSSTTYRAGDVVRHGGWLFYSLADSFNDNPVSNLYQLENRSNPIVWKIISKGIRFIGEWNIENSYKTGDIVRRGGQLFQALLDTELTADGSSLDYLDDSNWELLVSGQDFKSSWNQEIFYGVGDVVVFFGTAFTCKLGHESNNTNFPSLDVASAGTGFTFWEVLVPSGSESGLQYRGDLLTYNLTRNFYGDDSSFGLTHVPVGSNGRLLSINEQDDIIYKNYGEVNRVFYVAKDGIDDRNDLQCGVSPFKPFKTVKFACERADDDFAGTTTIRVRTGHYEEVLPIIVPANIAIVGDELRSTSIVAATPDESLTVDRTFTVAILTRVSELIQSIITVTPLTVAKSLLNPLDPTILTEIQSGEQGETEIIIKGSIQSALSVQALIVDMQRYINFFVNSTGTNSTLFGTNVANTTQEYTNTVKILNANREFLKEEVVAFMKQTFPQYNFNEDLYKLNVDRYIEAWIYDIIYSGNYKSLLEARYYRNAVLGSTLEDMFYVRDSTSIRSLTLAGLDGRLNPPNVNNIFRLPTGGAYVSLDSGWGPDDTRVWISKRSPYIQNVTTLGRGSIGQKIDGALHNGGNRSIVSNDFTQVIDEGIGAWVLNQGRAELVSVFSYYAHVGYLATDGGIIRATNGNNSYGTFGSVANGNDLTEIPRNATVNNRNQQASATIFAGDFTDEIQIIEWENAGQNYTQATAQFIGAGANADVLFEDFRDDAVYTVEILDTSDTIAQRIGGSGYIRVQNNAQVHEITNGDLTSITIASNDANTQADYLGCRIILTSGPGTGQYAYITAYDTVTKVVSVARERDNQPGWDHLIPGTPPTVPLESSTAYRIEPRAIFSEPRYEAKQFALRITTDWGSIAYGETTETYTNIVGQAGSGDVEQQDGLEPITATFDIEKIARTYSVTVNNAGAGYKVGDEIFVTGDTLGGATPFNDLLIVVTSVTDDSTNSILTISFSGEGASGKFVAITEGGTAGLYSENGESWPDGFSMPTAGDWTCLAAGNNRFVAIRTGSDAAASSLNGVTWTARTMPESRNWKAVTYGGDKFVAVASDQNSAAYSTNGETWTATSMPTVGDDPTINEWKDITYGKNQFVAVANSQNVAATSADGISWTGVVISNDSPKEWVSVAYGNNRYVTISSTGDVLYSFTATTGAWLPASLPEPDVGYVTWRKIRYAQGVFFALAESENETVTSFAATSPDGEIWTVRKLATNSSWKDIAFGNPYVEQVDSSIGKSTPMWVAISNTNVTNNISTGATALGRVEVTAGIISKVKLWNTGSNYRNEPTLVLVSPTATSDAVFQCKNADGVLTNPSWMSRGIGYKTGTTKIIILGNGFSDVIPVGKFVTLENFSRIPGPGAQIFFNDNPTRYTIVTTQPSNSITNSNNIFVRITPELRIRDNLQHATGVIIREKYSQIRITGHDFLDIGTGNFEQTNYPDLYAGAFFSAPEDEVREENGGRVFYTSTDQSGNFRTGELFAVEQATGIVTISADFFDLGGLEEIKLGGIRVGGSGAIIKEFSTDPTMSEDSNNIVPTQRAIAAFLSNRLSLGGSEITVFQIQAGQVFLGGPDRISNTLGLKIMFPGIVNFSGADSGVSGAMLAQNMFYRSFNN